MGVTVVLHSWGSGRGCGWWAEAAVTHAAPAAGAMAAAAAAAGAAVAAAPGPVAAGSITRPHSHGVHAL
ncbi:hypothetical protein CLOM_g21677 [Closterium sp. NIES-68]|nr:hypothetical protein CLOM_g21677 [Closterium sp. NIES-68]GJP71812.1 hypothetical protein CLOP_g2603 [Closterium sp. NIES-67]